MASGDSGENINKCDCQKERVASVTRCTPDNQQATIYKLVQLIGEPLSADSYDRHFILLTDLIRAITCGFWVQDLLFVMRLLDLLIDRFDEVCLYREPLKSLLAQCAFPPMLTRTSEVLVYSRDLQQYFAFLGFLIVRLKEPQFQDLAIQVLCSLLTKKNTVAIYCVKLETCHKSVEKSDLPNIITQLLEIADEELFVKLLKVVVILANISDEVCIKMINAKAIDFLMLRLYPEWNAKSKNVFPPDPPDGTIIPNHEIIEKLLWILLSVCKNKKDLKCNFTIPSVEALANFRYAFKALIKEKDCEVHRNHMMGILLMCLEAFPDLPLVQCGLAYDIGLLGAAMEMGTGSTWASQVYFSVSDVDYEFKKMLLLAMCYCTDSSTIIGLHPKRIIPALLKIITPELSSLWHPLQQKKLMSLALNTLQVLVPHLPEAFVYYDGPLRLLIMAECCSLEMYDLETLKSCLRALSCIAGSKNHEVLENLKVHDASGIITHTCDYLLSCDILTLAIQQCLSHAFSLLEMLCIVDNCQHMSVNLCLKFMNRVVNPKKNDPILDPKCIICAIGFLWEGVVWGKGNLKAFISKGGVYHLLDIIHSSIFAVKLVALGALVDMCDEGLCVPHLVTWRKNGQTLLSMLLQLFREENVKLGVQNTNNGVIEDIEFPLMGQQQWYETFYEIKDPNSSPATIDLLGSCRPKIYALIQLLTNRHEQRVAIVNKHYQLYTNKNLTTQEQITLLLAENFLALKLGEAWVELGKDIEKSGIHPLSIEKEIIARLTRRLYRWSLHLKTIQERLEQQELKNDCKDEFHFYRTLYDSKLIESLKALHELDYIARTTERMFRLVTKMSHITQIDTCLDFTEGAEHHKTYMRDLKITPVFNQLVDIQSNRVIDPKEEIFDLSPVSCSSRSESIKTEDQDQDRSTALDVPEYLL